MGAWLVGLDIVYDNQRRLCCDTEWKCTQQVRVGGGGWGARCARARALDVGCSCRNDVTAGPGRSPALWARPALGPVPLPCHSLPV